MRKKNNLTLQLRASFVLKKILTLFFFSLPFLSLAQLNKYATYWLPTDFVDSVYYTGEFTKFNFLQSPIEMFVHDGGKWYVSTHTGMLQPILYNRKSGFKTIRLNKLSMNLKYYKVHEQDSINKCSYFITPYSDSLLLEVYKDKQLLRRSLYSKSKGSYVFEQQYITINKLLISGKYFMKSVHENYVDSALQIDLNGKVLGGKNWLAVKVVREVVNELNLPFTLATVHQRDGNILKLALTYNEREKVWRAYEYKETTDNFSIVILSEEKFLLKKIEL